MDPLPYSHVLVIANPVAGRGRGERAAKELVHGLEQAGTEVELFLTGGRGEGRARVAQAKEDTDLVISVGGDGTLNEVLRGLADPSMPVAVLAMGTANVLSVDLKLPRKVPRFIEFLRTARRSSLNVAEVAGRLSFLVSGIGADGFAVHELERRRVGPITKFSYVPAALRALRNYTEPRLEVTLDGEPIPGEWGWVLFSNIIHYGGVMRLDSSSRIDDGLFEAYLFPRASRLRLMGIFAGLLLGRAHRSRGVVARQARSIEVRSKQPVPVQIDGDEGAHTPFSASVSDTSYTLLVPQ